MALRILYSSADQFTQDGKPVSAFVRDRKCDYECYVPPGYSSNGGITFASPMLFRQLYYAWASRLELCYLFSVLYVVTTLRCSLAMQHQKAFRESTILVYPSQRSLKIL